MDGVGPGAGSHRVGLELQQALPCLVLALLST